MRTSHARCAPRPFRNRRRPARSPWAATGSRPPLAALLPIPLAALLLIPLAALVACGDEGPAKTPDVSAAIDPVPISGLYDVKGVTRSTGGPGEERRIAGTVILKHEGDAYTATFKLDTTFPGAEDPIQADVIGNGEGSVDGRKLTGTASTQLVVSTVPGVDTDFAFVPRIVGARIVSSAVTEIAPDGTLVIELENMPAEGELDYVPTRTRLTGRRIADNSAAALPRHEADR